MISKRKPVVIVLVLLLSILTAMPSFTQRTKSSLSAGNQRKSEKSLKDNKYFFFFINPAVSNMGVEEEKSLFTEALRRDLIARILYMRFSFDLSFEEIKKSQIILIDLYRKVLKREIDETKALLNESAAEVMESDSGLAKKYMALGYRSSKWAEKVVLMADNINEKNYSIKLYEYVKAMKNVKTAKRYAIAALLEKRIPLEEKINLSKKKHRRVKEKNKINYDDFEEVRVLIEKYIPEKKEKYLLVHRDNHYIVVTSPSLFDSIMDNPGLENIPEYETYQKDK